MEPIWSLGLMSGTSLDGVDAAWLKTDGEGIQERGGGMMVPYPSVLRKKLRSVLGQTLITSEIKEADRELTLFHADVVRQAQENQSFDLIGFHGQTLFHAPPQTYQIGDGPLLAKKAGVDVVYDFRTADVAQGGQGAPLAPVFHQGMVLQERGEGPIAIVNIGGVANVTWIQKGCPLIACDTGPGGALLDDWVWNRTGQPYDHNGQWAAQGRVDEGCIHQWLSHPYFTKVAPKSLDRGDFISFIKDIEGFSVQDGAATLAELTARSIIQALAQMPSLPKRLYVTGGGRRNNYLLTRLTGLAPYRVSLIEMLGWDGDLLEAYAFAYLAVRVKRGLPTSFSTTTGVAIPVSGGRLASCPSRE